MQRYQKEQIKTLKLLINNAPSGQEGRRKQHGERHGRFKKAKLELLEMKKIRSEMKNTLNGINIRYALRQDCLE